MDRAKAERSVVRRKFSMCAQKLEKLLENCDEFIPAEFEKLKKLFEELSLLQNKIVSIWLDDDNRDLELFDKDIEEADIYESRYYILKQKASKVFISSPSKTSVREIEAEQLSSKSNGNRHFKLPKLELPRYNGEIKQWLRFWSQFKKIHLDEQIDNDDKFHYLLQCMEVGSVAREFLESFPPSGENYNTAVEQLKNRFAKDEMIIEYYVRELLNLVLAQAKGVQKGSIRILYDAITTQILALESMGVTQEKYSSFLLPLVESALPEELLKAWNRSHRNDSGNDNILTPLSKLLNFVKSEVESEERIRLSRFRTTTNYYSQEPNVSSAACLNMTNNKDKNKRPTESNQYEIKEKTCVWCNKLSHTSSECTTAIGKSLEERKELLRMKNACYICLNIGHSAKRCRKYPKCVICCKRHFPIMCTDIKKSITETNTASASKESQSVLNQSLNNNKTVLLQTLKAKLYNGNNDVIVRVLLDSGAQQTFITKDIASKLKLKACDIQEMSHNLFGGTSTQKQMHNIYNVTVGSLDETYKCIIKAYEQNTICSNIPKIRKESNILTILKEKGVFITDAVDDISKIDLLIGSDFLGTLLTGRAVRIDDYLFATETKLGWTVQGPAFGVYCSSESVSALTCSYNIEDFWNLETLGIKDDAQSKSPTKREEEVDNFFKDTLRINEESRYEVRLPWKETGDILSSNYEIALKRLRSTTLKLTKLGLLSEYNQIFNEWLSDDIIEIVKDDDISCGHYLPHHAVVKDSSLTTKIRPVFDASASTKEGICLNSCLEKGVNLIEDIPRLLIQFRKGAIGITSDIKKAFLQISLHPEDRRYLKFLWWKDVNAPDKHLKTFRHKRVVFGVTTSPYLLSATITYHLQKYDNDVAKRLKNSFYVDNCVVSVNTEEDMNIFISKAKEIMNEGKFELRCWVTGPVITDNDVTKTSVLGLIWYPQCDELGIKIPLPNPVGTKMTKRTLLSIAQSIFDPIGFSCPTTLIPKLLIQKCWERKANWDNELPKDIQIAVNDWLQNLGIIEQCRIPRRLSQNLIENSINTLHIFSDASQSAYASSIFLRSEFNNIITVRLILAKTRVTPSKPITMPRLELIAALMGTRLAATAKNGLLLQNCQEYYWTDSSIVIAWIRKHTGLSIFVHNRVNEIISNTNIDDWHHISGDLNPADLPSRGCSPQQLVKSKWWEGPEWLRKPSTEWPISEIVPDETEINKEIRNNNNCMTLTVETFSTCLQYFSKYSKIVRMVGWCFRFYNNCRNKNEKIKGNISATEYIKSERIILAIIQKESLSETNLKFNLQTFTDKDGLTRIKTRLTLSQDTESFRTPILLPSNNMIIIRLVTQTHVTNFHCGSQTLISILRENYWILGIRRLAKKVVRQCITCKRFSVKAGSTPPSPLPVNRIACGSPFEVTGIDFAGPLLMKTGEKCWIALFTCAVYRAVHLELCTSLSTEDFLLALRRFLARRGKVKIIYSDNGTNFRGAANVMNEFNSQDVSTLTHKIEWRFLPPSAPWWGGFWERMVRSVKDILRRMLGKSSLNYCELVTILCEVESIINARPLTYIAESSESLITLTPAMFLNIDMKGNEYDDLSHLDSNILSSRWRYMKKLSVDLKQRFRNEYLSLLIQKAQKDKDHTHRVGDVVLVGCDNVKRLYWPLGLILDIYPGVDGCTRVAKVKTAMGERIRPIQRLYALEVDTRELTETKSNTHSDDIGKIPESVSRYTRTGRLVKLPHRLDL